MLSRRRLLAALAAASAAAAAELHVALSGDDGSGDGSAQRPFRTVQHAAEVARAGDAVTVGGRNRSSDKVERTVC